MMRAALGLLISSIFNAVLFVGAMSYSCSSQVFVKTLEYGNRGAEAGSMIRLNFLTHQPTEMPKTVNPVP
jgi:hypothetical protein